MNKIIKILIIVTMVFLAIVMFTPSLRSRVIMGAATWSESFRVLGKEEGLSIEFESPSSAKGERLSWYPMMLLFNSHDLSYSTLGIEGKGTVDMSIYYTFGDFANGRSVIYDVYSTYGSAFYGAYIVKLNPESGNEGPIALEKLTEAITRYDYTSLILLQLGLGTDDVYFEPEVEKIAEDINAFASEGWTRIDASIKTRSISHNASEFKQHYLQFGRPMALENGEDFPQITLFGRTYSKYFAEEDLYVVFYVQAVDKDLVEKTDSLLLNKSKVTRGK